MNKLRFNLFFRETSHSGTVKPNEPAQKYYFLYCFRGFPFSTKKHLFCFSICPGELTKTNLVKRNNTCSWSPNHPAWQSL